MYYKTALTHLKTDRRFNILIAPLSMRKARYSTVLFSFTLSLIP